MAADALRGPQPDPETGLVPCGCGMPAKWFGIAAEFDGDTEFHAAGCSGDCPAVTEWEESQDVARKAWNKMMGHREQGGNPAEAPQPPQQPNDGLEWQR